MDVQRFEDGRWHISLGPVEKWVVGLCGAAIVVAFGIGFDYTATTMQKLVIGQALANAQLQNMSVTMAGVPAMQQQGMKVQVEVDRNTQDIANNTHDIRELQQVRGHLQ